MMSSLRTFDLNLLVAFDVLMRELNVTRAAEQMFITQSAMSHILQRLRQQLDDPLLVKTPSGMKPTERALALIAPVRELLIETERLIQRPSKFDEASSQRRFVLAATDYLEFLLIPALTGAVAQIAPSVDLHVKRTETTFPVTPLENGGLDVVLGFASVLTYPAHLRCQTLFDDEMVCVVRQNHPIIRTAPSLENYIAVPHMLISWKGTPAGIIDQPFAGNGPGTTH